MGVVGSKGELPLRTELNPEYMSTSSGKLWSVVIGHADYLIDRKRGMIG